METKTDISQGTLTAKLVKNNELKIRTVQHRWFHTAIDWACSKIHKNKKYYEICRIKTEIREHIAAKCCIPTSSIYLCGLEQLETWFKRFPEVAKEADLDPVDSPLIISPDDLAEVVQALAKQKKTLSELIDNPPTARVSYEQKNKLNNMSVEYAKEQRKKYLKETAQIHTFLAAPENFELMLMYESVVDEFQFKIISKRKDYQTFDSVLEYLVDLLFNRDPILRQRTHKRLTRALLFYMYWNCDIGEAIDDSTDEALSS